jgi:hypothetical protein
MKIKKKVQGADGGRSFAPISEVTIGVSLK